MMFGIAEECAPEPSADHAEDASLCGALCRAHWSRLFLLARRSGCEVHDAEDAVQEMFEKLVRRGLLAALARQPAETQSAHLAVRMRCHLMNRWRDGRRLQRGGAVVIVPLVSDDGCVVDVPDTRAEDARGSATDIHRKLRALARLRMEMKPQNWSRLAPWLMPADDGGTRQTSGATRVALHRARRRLRELMLAAALVCCASALPLIAHEGQGGHAAAPTAAASVTITIEGDERVIRANGIPDHQPGAFPRKGNPNRISPQSHNFRVTTKPQAGAQPVSAQRGWFGVALNGVPFEAGTAEFWSQEWRYEAIGGTMNLGLDEHLAHVQPTGAYHYHGLPAGLVAARGGDDKTMLLIGWAADGFPIYTSRAHADAKDATSALKPMRPSYKLRPGMRPPPPHGPGGAHNGAFTADYEFVAGSGDLDECNGRTGVTPEFPQGTYYYCLTAEFPFAPRMWRGTPDASFMKRGPPRRR